MLAYFSDFEWFGGFWCDGDLCMHVLLLCFSDFGFDPLRLGEVPENLERFKESELIHCRWAMLAVVSVFCKKKKKTAVLFSLCKIVKMLAETCI